jgi:phosphohistidine phosphatase
MDVLLIRHGKAGARDPNRWPDDDKRPLTSDGVAEMREVCGGMLRLGVTFEYLVTSPLVRARQTADIVAEVYEWKEAPQESEALGHNCTAKGMLQLLAKFPPDAAVALVGHEPDFSRATAELIARSGDAAIELKKGGVAAISFEGPAALGLGTLSFLLKPSHLRKISKNRR